MLLKFISPINDLGDDIIVRYIAKLTLKRLVVYSSGFGFPIVVRSLATFAATANHLSVPLLYSGLAIAETIGSFVGATVLTAAFTNTIGIGGAIAGVPFYVCSVRHSFLKSTKKLSESYEEVPLSDTTTGG